MLVPPAVHVESSAPQEMQDVQCLTKPAKQAQLIDAMLHAIRPLKYTEQTQASGNCGARLPASARAPSKTDSSIAK